MTNSYRVFMRGFPLVLISFCAKSTINIAACEIQHSHGPLSKESSPLPSSKKLRSVVGPRTHRSEALVPCKVKAGICFTPLGISLVKYNDPKPARGFFTALISKSTIDFTRSRFCSFARSGQICARQIPGAFSITMYSAPTGFSDARELHASTFGTGNPSLLLA